MVEVNNKIAEPRPGYSISLPAGIWHCTVGKQCLLANKHSRHLGQGQATRPAGLWPCNMGQTNCNETIQAPRPRLGLSPCPVYGVAQWENNLQGNIQFARAMYVGPLHPILLPMLSLLRSIQISKGVCQGKNSRSFNRRSS